MLPGLKRKEFCSVPCGRCVMWRDSWAGVRRLLSLANPIQLVLELCQQVVLLVLRVPIELEIMILQSIFFVLNGFEDARARKGLNAVFRKWCSI